MANLTERPRRLRYNSTIRDMIAEHSISHNDLIYPLFVKEGLTHKKEISSMPGIFQFSLKEIAKEALDCYKKGLKAVILFGIPQKKDNRASQAYNPNGIVQQAISTIKDKCPKLVVISDVCLCEYMDHGHCGVINDKKEIENDESLELLARTAFSHAKAGADIVAPSDMMDGRVGVIRRTLDGSGFLKVPIMSYAVKFASHFYGPFREAAESPPSFGDRKTYQMDFRNSRDVLREARLDEEEGADFLIVKPALPYLDVLYQLKESTKLPLVAYQVSGEYSMICSSALKGWCDKEKIVLESLIAMKRAGAKLLITYFAKEILKSL